MGRKSRERRHWGGACRVKDCVCQKEEEVEGWRKSHRYLAPSLAHMCASQKVAVGHVFHAVVGLWKHYSFEQRHQMFTPAQWCRMLWWIIWFFWKTKVFQMKNQETLRGKKKEIESLRVGSLGEMGGDERIFLQVTNLATFDPYTLLKREEILGFLIRFPWI